MNVVRMIIAVLSLGFVSLNASPSLQVLQETQETHEIVKHLKVYEAYHDGSLISLRRIGRANDGGYVVPELAMRLSDAVMGYGISNDISFEDAVVALYDKFAFGFDGTCPPVHPKHKKCQFISSNIISSKAAAQIHPRSRDVLHPFKKSTSFDQQLDALGFRGKPLFIKMDIEGNEYDTMPDILRHASYVTGIVLEIHFLEDAQIPQALSLLKMLDQDFLLVHLHGNNCAPGCFITSNSAGYIPRVLELTYINKRLVDSYEIAPHQNHPSELDMPNNVNEMDAYFEVLGELPSS